MHVSKPLGHFQKDNPFHRLLGPLIDGLNANLPCCAIDTASLFNQRLGL